MTGSTETLAVDPGELITRYMLASTIRKAGELDVASAENAKILSLDPDHIPARMSRAVEAIERRHFGEAQRDLIAVLNHPDLIGYLRQGPDAFALLPPSITSIVNRRKGTRRPGAGA